MTNGGPQAAVRTTDPTAGYFVIVTHSHMK
jgi:hypothetical protein